MGAGKGTSKRTLSLLRKAPSRSFLTDMLTTLDGMEAERNGRGTWTAQKIATRMYKNTECKRVTSALLWLEMRGEVTNTNPGATRKETLWSLRPSRPQRGVMHDFGGASLDVLASQHVNGGGWVADTAEVDDSVYVGPFATVEDNARVHDDAILFDHAKVCGEAVVGGSAMIGGHAVIWEGGEVIAEASVMEYARVFGGAEVTGEARISGNAQVAEQAFVAGSARVYGKAVISGHARLLGEASVSEAAEVRGHATVTDRGRVGGRALIDDGASICGSAHVTGDVAVDGLQVIDAGVVSSAEDLEGPPQPIIRVGDDELASLSF